MSQKYYPAALNLAAFEHLFEQKPDLFETRRAAVQSVLSTPCSHPEELSEALLAWIEAYPELDTAFKDVLFAMSEKAGECLLKSGIEEASRLSGMDPDAPGVPPNAELARYFAERLRNALPNPPVSSSAPPPASSKPDARN
jgi:hypothetical protein